MAQVSTAPAQTPTPSETIQDATFGSRRGAILIVEDRDDVRQGLQQLLEIHGFLVFDAPDGEQALAQLTGDPGGFALILLDLMLPGPIAGRDMRARQLADPRLAAIPMIVVSACEPDLRGRAQLRPEAWFEKPFRFDDLLEVVKKYVTPEPGGFLLRD